MHDIVSHNLTVMIGLADGAGYALQAGGAGAETALTAMERASQTGRQALDEMRRLLGVLRDEPESGGPYEPQPGLDRLDDLLARVEAAGIPVSFELEGDPHELGSGVQLAIFRVAQEALTNTLKHAGRPVSAHLALRCGSGRVTLEVTDTGGRRSALRSPAAGGALHRGGGLRDRTEPLPSGGRGLSGMRERAAAYGGELEAGPRPQGGWRVCLTLAADVGTVVGR
jgi:signal transduction histidine kinase